MLDFWLIERRWEGNIYDVSLVANQNTDDFTYICKTPGSLV